MVEKMQRAVSGDLSLIFLGSTTTEAKTINLNDCIDNSMKGRYDEYITI